MRNILFPLHESDVIFIHLDEDNQEIPSLRGVNSCTVYIALTEKI